MQERINELNAEMKQSSEEKKIIQNFIFTQEKEIPAVVLDTLNKQIRRLDITVLDCELRLKNYE